jgi:nucleoside-diphosphate-sugar epimerase
MDSFRGMSVAVTGAAGFLGRRLVERLRELGARVTCLVAALDRAPIEWSQEPRPDVVLADVTRAMSVMQALIEAQPSRVFHLAARTAASDDLSDLPRYLEVNTVGTACVIAACRKITSFECLVAMGTGEEYGPSESVPFTEEHACRPRTPYGISKAAATLTCMGAYAREQFPVTVLRGFLLYGRQQSPRFFLAQLQEAARSGKPLDMTGGEQTRDFLHVDDAVQGILLASLASQLRGQIANLCSGQEHRLIDVAHRFASLAGASNLVVPGALPYRPGEIMRYVGDARKLREATGWEPRIAFDEGLAELAANPLSGPEG